MNTLKLYGRIAFVCMAIICQFELSPRAVAQRSADGPGSHPTTTTAEILESSVRRALRSQERLELEKLRLEIFTFEATNQQGGRSRKMAIYAKLLAGLDSIIAENPETSAAPLATRVEIPGRGLRYSGAEIEMKEIKDKDLRLKYEKEVAEHDGRLKMKNAQMLMSNARKIIAFDAYVFASRAYGSSSQERRELLNDLAALPSRGSFLVELEEERKWIPPQK